MSINYTFVDRFDSMGYPVRMNKDKDTPSLSIKKSFSDSFVNDIIDKLPENGNLPTRHPEWMIPCDLHFKETCTVRFTYITEGAGYRNTVGYYVYDTANPPTHPNQVTDRRIFIPNYSGNERTKFFGLTGGGSLQMGDSIDLPYEVDSVNFNHNYVFPAGKSVGFFIMSNAWRGNGSWINGLAPNASDRINPSTDVMFSNPDLNVNNPVGHKHQFVCLQSKIDPDIIIYGIEDIRRPGGDKDFNDAVYTIEASPITAIDDSSFIKNRETEVTTWGTVFVEDDIYDNDYNDVIFTYQATEKIDDDNEKIKAIQLDVELLARGSWHDHRVGVKIPNISGLSGTATRQIRNVQGEYLPVEDISSTVFSAANTDNKVPIIPCTKQVTSSINGGDGFGWNSGPKWQERPQTSTGFRLVLTFQNPISRAEINGELQPFIFYVDVADIGGPNADINRDGVARTYFADQEYEDSSYYWKYQKIAKVPKILFIPRYISKMPQDKQPIWVSYPFIVPYLKSNKNQDFKWYKYPQQCYNLETVVPAVKNWNISL